MPQPQPERDLGGESPEVPPHALADGFQRCPAVPLLGHMVADDLIRAVGRSLRQVSALLVGLASVATSGLGQQSAPTAPLSLVLEIGEEAGPSEYTFHRIGAIAVSPSGTLYVLDSGDKQVKVFSPTGEHVRSFGRAGGGPGEFLFPVGLRVDSLVRIFDPRAARVTTFSLSGALRGTESLSSLAGLPFAAWEPLRHGLTVGGTVARFSLGHASHQPHELVILAGPGARVDTVAMYHSGGVVWHAESRMLPWGMAQAEFGRAGAWAVAGDSVVVVADGYTGKVEWYRVSPRGLIHSRTGRLGLRSAPVEGRDLEAVEARLRSERKGLPSRIKMVAPPRWSIATQALFDDQGNLWVRNDDDSESGRTWTVFEGHRDAARRTTLPTGFELLAVRSGLLYGRAETEGGAPVVRVYRGITSR